MTKNIFLLFLLVSLFACKTNRSTTSVNLVEQAFQEVLDSVYTANPLSIGIIAHVESPKHKISWSGAAGYNSKAAKTAIDPKQPVLIASNTKTYVVATILRLQEMGKININSSIDSLLTDKTRQLFESDGYALDEITLKNLLSHTSGISDYTSTKEFENRLVNEPMYRWTRDEELALAVSGNEPLGKPGEMYKYADVNFLLATEIIEQKTGKPFYTSIRELLDFEALGLTQTWFETLEDRPAQIKPFFHQYFTSAGLDSRKMDPSFDLYGGGGLATTMEELARFNQALFTQRVLDREEVLDLIFTKVKTNDIKQSNYCLGLFDTKIGGYQAFGHGGFWGTIVGFVPEHQTTIAVSISERDQRHIKSAIQGRLLEILLARS